MDDSGRSAKVELTNVKQNIEEITNQIQILKAKQYSLLERKSFLEKHLKLLAERNNGAHDWSAENFGWSARLKEKCETLFGIKSFRDNQLETMNATMSGLDCILIMPTGAGKSLCYQLPATLGAGMTLVVSPLVSLMEDQLMSLAKRDISAVMLNASSSKVEVNTAYADMAKKPCPIKLMYVTPEKLAKSKRFMNKLEQCYKLGSLERIAIDEVHCCSQWGHDFRPDFKFLGILKTQYPKTPILGLTATASTQVLVDVQKILQIPHSQVFQGSFNRKNLYYSVLEKPADHSECMNSIRALIEGRFQNQSGIVYCLTRKDTTTVADDLNSHGIKSAFYHSDMDNSERSRVHSLWLRGKVQVIVATIAFGMGIDKPNVRFVIHHSLSKSIENYYQESGRAGRDGARADCILLFRLADAYRQSCMVFTESTGIEKLYSMVEYCHNQLDCRRTLMAGHFSEILNENDCDSMCDHCNSSDPVKSVASLANIDISTDILLVYEILDKARSKDTMLTGQKVLDALIGKGPKPSRGTTSSQLTKLQCETLIATMLTSGCIREKFHFTPYNTISYLIVGSRCMNISRNKAVKRAKPDTKENKKSKISRPSASYTDLTEDAIVLSD